MIRHLSAAALASACLVTRAAAQKVPIVQAGADGRFETQLDPKTKVSGFSPAQITAFRGEVGRLAGTLAAMPQVASPPAPLCNRLISWIEVQSTHGVLAGAVSVMSPIAFNNGRCHQMTGSGVQMRLNALSLLADPQQAFLRIDRGESDWFQMAPANAFARTVRFGDAIAFTHGRVPLFRAVSTERYLRELISRQLADRKGGDAGELARWLAEEKPRMLAENTERLREMAETMKPADLPRMAAAMQIAVDATEAHLRRSAATDRGPTDRQRLEAELAALDGGARSAPACIVAETAALDTAAGCPSGLILVELNPGYFDRSRPDAVQLLAIETPQRRTYGESDARLAARMAIWEALDHAKLAAIVR